VKSLYVLRNTYAVMPAVLIEVGFLSNAADAAKLRDRRWSEDLACNMAAALDG
jgi:N-acetylmuramoyl-L-alanine amidase